MSDQTNEERQDKEYAALEVKNKLDGGFYAKKLVQLNPESVNLNEKKTREVKQVRWKQEVKVEWSLSDAESEDDGDPRFKRSPEDESSNDIKFEDLSHKSESIPSEALPDTPRPPSESVKQVLCIQMEFYEKNLRHAIDNGLFKEHNRAWRLFREILEGLAHVHQRGMIHRDLKPANIFLDSTDHVKIGNFGLATKVFSALPVDEKKKQMEISGSLTGQIDTALYAAPELLESASKEIYNQKVDIYSLGIILFEMFHPPYSTDMERMATLTNLRTKDIILPKGFETEENAKQIHVIKWLLNHDASVRPTCAELLSSSHVPRPVAEGALSGLLSHTLNARGTRNYERLVEACLLQTPTVAEDITYHKDMRRPELQWLVETVTKIFQSHGAVEFAPPLLTPRVKAWDAYPNAVKVMTASGTVCHLPHDLRLPFARHVAYSGTKYMRRYVIDRVFREKQVAGFHPREIIECAFDIVSPKSDSLCVWSDAELLVVASRAASESGLKVTIQLNHTEILKTLVLFYCGVPVDKLADVCPILVDFSFGRITKLQLRTHLTSLCISDRKLDKFLQLMESSSSLCEVEELRRAVKPKWRNLMTPAAKAIDAVCSTAKALGCGCPIVVAPFLAYNATQHSGVFWQMLVVREEQKTTKYRAGDLIAAGGRYDPLVEEFCAKIEDSSSQKTCVGFSMCLEKMAAIVKKKEADTPRNVTASPSTLICVKVWGTAGSDREGLAAAERAHLARDLWAAGLNCCPCPQSMEHEHSGISVMAVKVPNIVMEESDSPILSVTFVIGGFEMPKTTKKYHENQINTQITAILTNLGVQCSLRRYRVYALAILIEAPRLRALSARLTSPLAPHAVAAAVTDVLRQFPSSEYTLKKVEHVLKKIARQHDQNRSTDETQLCALYSIPDWICKLITVMAVKVPNIVMEESNCPILSVTFVPGDLEMPKTTKKYHENQINTQITAIITNLGVQCSLRRYRVYALAILDEAPCVRALSARLTSPLAPHAVAAAVTDVIRQFPSSEYTLKKVEHVLKKIARQHDQNRATDETQLCALYSIPDRICKLIT